MRLNRLLAATALTGAAFALSHTAYAQDLPTQSGTSDTGDRSEVPLSEPSTVAGVNNTDIVVTGSRIARPNLEASAPITSVSVGQLTQTGNLSIGDALIRLPQIRSTFAQSNSTRFIGTAGLNLLDLRGLGTARTLVLVNGRRHITSQPGTPTSVDVNTIPTDLLQRVDVQTGGSSAVYGADAVAGVVNFVLRRDFEGVTGRVQGGISERGDRGSYLATITAGKNFAEGRGNVAVNAEYSYSDDLYYRQRDDVFGAFRGRDQFQAVENTIPEGLPTSLTPGTNGISDTQFVRNLRNINISEGGLYTASCPTIPTTTPPPTAAQIAEINARRAVVCNGLTSQTGQPLGFTYVFLPDGRLVRNDVSTDFRPFGSTNSVGGFGSTLRLTGQLQPKNERKAFNFLSSFEVTPAFRPFIEAKYVRVDAVQEGQPTFNSNTLSLNNPFLDTASRNLLVSTLAPGATSFAAFRFNTDFGGRGEDHVRETYRIVAGVDGTFNNDWKYELAFNYGRLETQYETQGNVINARYANAINAVRNNAGQIVCGINADVSTTNDDPACVPVNLLGSGQVSQASLNYFGFTSSREQEAEQYNVTAFVGGDLSQLFELPGGPVSFAIGGEYRRETAFSAFDETTRSGVTFLNAIPIFNPPALEAKEAFGELRIPIVKDRPYFHDLSLEGAIRYSDYSLGNVGGVVTYNVGGGYAPVDGFRARGSYGKSIRIPTQTNLFAAPSQTFLNVLDPCSAANINNNPNRRANCGAAGVPVNEIINGVSVPFTNLPASGIRGLNGSNPNLAEEESTSWSFGFVAQPRAIPGLSISVDYYNIEIENVIFTLGPQTIIDQCYDAPGGISNQYCAAVFRRPDGTFQGQSNRNIGGVPVEFPPLALADRSFIAGPFNFAKQITSGVDFNLNYTRTIGTIKFDVNTIVAYVARRDNFTDINRPAFRDQQLFELGDPRWRGSLNLTADFGNFDLAYNLRYIGKQVTAVNFEDQNSVDFRPPQNPDVRPEPFFNARTYHDLRLGVNTDDDRFGFYVGVDNVFDKFPPGGIDGTTEGGAIFDNIGRFFYSGARVKF